MRILLGWMNRQFDPHSLPYDIVTLGPKLSDLHLEDANTRACDLALPSGWQPDVLVWLLPEFFPPPPDLEEAFDCPMVVVFGDWNLGFNADLANLPRFGYAFADRLGTHILHQFGHHNVEEWLPYSVFAHHQVYWPDEPRRHDVTFCGNLSMAVQGERNRWLKRLAMLSDRFDVQIASGVFGEDYTRLLNQSKIVFNRTIRNELNMRCFEALAVKALLFVEEENAEAPDYLEDRVHCVYYNEDNLEALITHYLTHDEERQKVAEAGHAKWRELTYDVTVPRLFDRIQTLWQTGQIKRGKGRLSNMAQYYFNTRLTDGLSRGYLLLEEARKERHEKLAATRLLALVASDAALSHPTDSQFWAAKGVGYCLDVLAEVPQDPVMRYHLAECMAMRGRLDEALVVRERLCQDLEGDSLLPLLAEADHVSRGFVPLRTAWERVTFLSLGDRRVMAEGRRDLLLAACLARLGETLRASEPERAIACFKRSLECWPSQPKVLFDVSALLWEAHRQDEAIAMLRAGYDECPFDLPYARQLVEWLMAVGRLHEARDLVAELKLIVKATPGLQAEHVPLCQLQAAVLEKQRQELLQGF